MKLPLALLATTSGASAFTTVNNGPRSITELSASRQPIMAGNWKV